MSQDRKSVKIHQILHIYLYLLKPQSHMAASKELQRLFWLNLRETWINRSKEHKNPSFSHGRILIFKHGATWELTEVRRCIRNQEWKRGFGTKWSRQDDRRVERIMWGEGKEPELWSLLSKIHRRCSDFVFSRSCGWTRWTVGSRFWSTQHRQADRQGGWELLAGRQRRAGFGADVDQALAGLEAGQGFRAR